jgi:hypothetical protein
MTTSTVAPEIVAFAKGVRAALSDLPPEEVDDLTEGLEADLAESLAEDLRRTLPDPVAYAAELRTAAGVPPRKTERRGLAAELGRARDRARERLVAERDRNPAVASALDFVVTLRPAWWLVRAWVATWLLAWIFGVQDGWWFGGVFWIVLPVLALVSVQWGRDSWCSPATCSPPWRCCPCWRPPARRRIATTSTRDTSSASRTPPMPASPQGSRWAATR